MDIKTLREKRQRIVESGERLLSADELDDLIHEDSPLLDKIAILVDALRFLHDFHDCRDDRRHHEDYVKAIINAEDLLRYWEPILERRVVSD